MSRAEAQQQSQAPAVRGKADFLAMLEQSRDKIAAVLPEYLTPERMIRVAAAAYHRKAELQKCSPVSILAALMQAAEVGLEPDTPHQFAHLVPYGGECQFQVGYRGLIELGYRTGAYLPGSIDARTVCEADEFAIAYDPFPAFRHVPCLRGDAGQVTHAYAFAKTVDGLTVLEVMTAEQVEQVRAQSAMKNGMPWTKFWGEMAKKSAVKRLFKRQPKSPALARALELDADLAEVRPSTPTPRGSAALAQQLRGLPTPAPGVVVAADADEDDAWPEGKE
jgi:recombination protein RecT